MFDVKDNKNDELYMEQIVYFSSYELGMKNYRCSLEEALIYAETAVNLWCRPDNYTGMIPASLYNLCLIRKDFGDICDISTFEIDDTFDEDEEDMEVI